MPEAAVPVGYAALIDAYDLAVPMPMTLAAIGPRHKVYQAEGWDVYTPRHQPKTTLPDILPSRFDMKGSISPS